MNQKKGGLWTPDFCRILGANLLLLIAGNLLSSVFALFMVSRGGTELHIGIASYLYAIASLLMRPLAGWFLDHRSRRSIVLAGLVGLVLVPWGYIFVSQIAVLLAIRLCHGLLSASTSTGMTTNAYDTLSQEDFNRGVGYFGFSNAIATAVGPGMGLWIWNRYQAPGLFGAISAATLLALLLLRKFRFYEIPPEKRTRLRDEKPADLLYEKDALPAAVLEGFIALGSGAIAPYLTLFLLQRGDIANPGLFYTFQACGTFASRLFVGKISERYGEAPLVYSSTALFLCGISALVFSQHAALVFAGAVLMGIGYGFTVTGFQIMSVRIVPPARRGAAASTYSCGWDVFAALGGLLSGVLLTYFTYRTTFCLILLIYPAFLLAYVLVISKHPSAFRNQKGRERCGGQG